LHARATCVKEMQLQGSKRELCSQLYRAPSTVVDVVELMQTLRSGRKDQAVSERLLRGLRPICYSQTLKILQKTKSREANDFASYERNFFMSNDSYRRDSGDSVSTRLTYLLIGGGIGAVIALLFAPKSGQELRGDIADATRKGIDKSREAAQQLGERAGEYYDATRERATEVYSQASERASELYSQAASKVGEVAQTARETATRQTSTVAAAIDAGKKAYQEEKRKTEMSGRLEAAPKYTEKAN
jgi:gas vesicle protein